MTDRLEGTQRAHSPPEVTRGSYPVREKVEKKKKEQDTCRRKENLVGIKNDDAMEKNAVKRGIQKVLLYYHGASIS